MAGAASTDAAAPHPLDHGTCTHACRGLVKAMSRLCLVPTKSSCRSVGAAIATLLVAATGGSWTIKKRTAIDLSTGFGIGNHAHGPDYYFGIGISRLF